MEAALVKSLVAPQVDNAKPLKLKGLDGYFKTADRVRFHRLLNEKYECMDHEIFHGRGARKIIFIEAPVVEPPDTSWYRPVVDNTLSPMMVKQANKMLLSSEQERTLFLQFNYCRYKIVTMRDKILSDKKATNQQVRQVLTWHDKAEAYRHQIANTNLALVLAMAKRTRMTDVDFPELVSEGNMALLRAVDKFDVSRGFKFSTYACRAILKSFSRSGSKHTRYRQMFPVDFDTALEPSNYMEYRRKVHEDDCVDEIRTIFAKNLADLTQVEQEVIERRFALVTDQEPDNHEVLALSPMTLEQVGHIVGVTKERVRQIQNKALCKIRRTLEDNFLI